MAIVHQSDIASWIRCPTAFMYSKQGQPGKQLSATAYGSVMHYALETFERLRHTDGITYVDAVEASVETFAHYWHPLNISTICEPVTVWIPRQGYAELRARGIDAIRAYCQLMKFDDHELLATEYGFQVPIDGTWDEDLGEPHILAGTIDRLAVRRFQRKPFLAVDDYKGLALTTPIATTTGWTTMGDIGLGDQVFDGTGHPCSVIGVSEIHDRPCYRITFDDGTNIIADNEHTWRVSAGVKGDDVRDLSTQQLRAQLTSESTGQRDKRIPNLTTLTLPEVPLPVHPYVLGAWLGDGKHTDGTITKPDEELFDLIRACGFDVGLPHGPARDPISSRTVYGLRTKLRLANLLGNKHVPDVYLRASSAQRLALLQGLMDTDGTWNRGRKQAVFNNTDKALAMVVQELALSLGAKAPMWPYTAHGFGRDVQAYNVSFSPVDFNPFRLSRKADLVRDATSRSRRRLIVSVEPIVSVATRCIEVDSPDSMYLCGEQMVPTHNSGKEYRYLRQNLQFSAYSYATTKLELWTGWRGEDGFGPERGTQLYERFKDYARRGTWINLKTVKFQDAGWRGPQDYRRFALAVEQIVASMKADIYPLSLSGDTCTFCEFRDICTGSGVPANDHGAP